MQLFKLLKYILPALWITLAISCAEEIPLPDEIHNQHEILVDGENLILEGSMSVPDMQQVETRSLGMTLSLPDMHLYFIEFTDEGSPLVNTYIRTYEAEEEIVSGNLIKFKLTLRATTRPRILHLIALPKTESLSVKNGVEGAILPELTTTGGVDAYWRRLRFPTGYCSEAGGGKWQPDPDLKKKLTEVQLIRNFAKISMRSEAPDFTLKGFEVINIAGKGSMVPWNTKTHTFPEFFDTDGSIRDFKELSEEYEGYLPVNTPTLNQVSGPAVPGDFGLDDKYFYERPLNPEERSYIIVKGFYKDADYYYKLDIGQNDDNGIFQYYHLLRNFNFIVNIKSVNAKGYTSAADAAQGSVYNNISFDIDLSHLMNMSDGKEIIYVSYTTKVLTSPEPQKIDFEFRYVDMASGKNNNSGYKLVGLKPGEVIESVSTETNLNGWKHVDINIKGAQTETKMQSFTVVKPSTGLGRMITLILHAKWDLANIRTYPKSRKDWGSEANIDKVRVAQKAPFTLFFDLPNNLSESLFPLDFTIESEEQVIENEPGIGFMDVKSGESLYNPNVIRIQYHRHITWTQYTTMLDIATANGGLLIKEGDKEIHRVYCHFRNTMQLNKTKQYHIRIRNDNFNDGNVAVTPID